MSLGEHQKIYQDDINFRCETTGSAGAVVCYNTSTDHVGVTTTLSRVAAGILMEDVINQNLPSNLTTITEDTGTIDGARNFSKNQTYVSGVVRILKIGEIVTNQTSGTFQPGQAVYHTPGGLVSTTNTGGTLIGHALGEKDSNNFVKLWVNIR